MSPAATELLQRLQEGDSGLRELLLEGEAVPRSVTGLAALGAGLAASTVLRCLRVQDDSRDLLLEVAKALRSNTSLEDLVIASSALGDEVCGLLAEALALNNTLRRLHLDCLAGSGLGDVAGVVLATAVRANSVLRVLNVQGACCKIGDETGRAMAAALRVNRSLCSLRLAGRALSDDTGVALAEALQENSTLQHAFLAGCSIGSTGCFVAAMAKTLCTKTTALRSLAIENHHISDASSAALAGLLWAKGSALEALHIVCAGASDSTGLALAEALGSSPPPALRELHLDGLGLQAATLLAMAVALETNMRLRSLSLLNPCLNLGPRAEAAGAALARALRTNRSLRSLRLAFGELGDEICVRLAEALTCNASLTTLLLHGGAVGDASIAAVARALEVNVVLRRLHLDALYPREDHWAIQPQGLHSTPSWPPSAPAAGGAAGVRLAAALQRNLRLPEHWRLLTWLARKSESSGIRRAVEAMTEQGFCHAVFAFFLPPGVALPGLGAPRLPCGTLRLLGADPPGRGREGAAAADAG